MEKKRVATILHIEPGIFFFPFLPTRSLNTGDMGVDIINTYTVLLIALTTWGGKSKFLCKKKNFLKFSEREHGNTVANTVSKHAPPQR